MKTDMERQRKAKLYLLAKAAITSSVNAFMQKLNYRYELIDYEERMVLLVYLQYMRQIEFTFYKISYSDSLKCLNKQLEYLLNQLDACPIHFSVSQKLSMKRDRN